jgi:hypothetical protein
MPLAPTDIRSLARKYTEQAIETLVHVMRAPQAPPAARVLAANSLLDRGWGKAAQLVAVDGEIRQLVEVKLNVVTPNNLEQTTTKLLTNPEKSNDINAVDLSDTPSTPTDGTRDRVGDNSKADVLSRRSGKREKRA